MRNLFRAALIAGTVIIPAAAGAQSGLEPRVDRLEREMRAVQRNVFPGGAGRTVQPDIVPPDATQSLPGSPAGGALVDLETRVTAIERQQTTLTGQIEQGQYRLRQLEEAFAAYRRATDARLAASEQGGAAPGGAPLPAASTPGPRPTPTAVAPRPTATPARPTAGATPAATPSGTTSSATRADPARAERVAQVERPASGDGAEDGYLYGYRLWEAKLYPEAQVALKDAVDKYPKHRRASYAQNLLGRAYLDEGRPSLASMAFYDSFKKFPDGERAPDSLYYLGQSLMKLNKAADACKVYAELEASYGSKLSADLRAKAAKGRADAKCTS